MAQAPLVELFTKDINEVIDRYRSQGITVAEVLGALYLTLHCLADEAQDMDDGDKPWFGSE